MFEYLSYILVGLALAADASSVSIVYGLKNQPFRWTKAFIPAICFGVAQGVMPALGWWGGTWISQWLERWNHWIAFGILLIIGIKFIYDSRHEAEVKDDVLMHPLLLLLLAIATSIDAFAVGFSMSLTQKPILVPALIYGVVTMICSLVCSRIGAKVGEKFGTKLLVIGGIILIGIGIKILLEHFI